VRELSFAAGMMNRALAATRVCIRHLHPLAKRNSRFRNELRNPQSTEEKNNTDIPRASWKIEPQTSIFV
jgi:CRISPR/Cas system CSM-associated protein Csm3 (group 7 of RAMP superfamily)